MDDEWKNHDIEKEIFAQQGFEVKVTRSDTLEKDVPVYAAFADGVVAQVGFPCKAELIDKLDVCKVIAISGVGFNHVDIEEATKRGMVVSNVPDYCSEEVSDHTVTLMLAITRRIAAFNQKVKEGKWDPLDTLPIHRFNQNTVGLLGFGRIARMVATKLKAFGVRIIAHDEYVSEEVFSSHGVEPVSLDELLRQSNILSLHVPLTPETENLLNYGRLKQLPKGAFIVNTCRGAVIDEEALERAIKEGHIAGAGLDVLAQEPPELHHPLLSMKEVFITPHSSYVSEESLAELKRRTCQIIIDGVKGIPLNYSLNQPDVII
nr:C-terminal binding protein [Neobacillus paridis]